MYISNIRNRKIGVKVMVITFTLILFAIISFSYTTQSECNEIRKIKYLFNMPFVLTDGKLENRTDSVSIYYKQNQTLYEMPYIDILTDQNYVSTYTTKYRYFVVNNGATKGSYYRTIDATEYKDLPKDSILKSLIFYGSDFFQPENYIPFSVTEKDKKYSVVEKYLSKKTTFDYPDTAVYYYSDKLKGVEHSLSKYLDSARKVKLVKVRLLNNKKYFNEYKLVFPKREWRFEMREDTIGDVKKYLKFFEKFNNELKK